MRRAFQFFDADGSGTIDIQELAHALKMKTMLVFEPQILDGVYARFDSDGAGINYQRFCEIVMGSRRGDATSVGDSDQGSFAGCEGEKLLQAVQRRVREKSTWKEMWTALGHLDSEGTGKIGKDALRHLLRTHNVLLSDKQFEWLCVQCVDEDEEDEGENSGGSNTVTYLDFMELFPPYV